MSVRATERLIGDIVFAPGLENGPKMIVQSVDIELKLITTVWFLDNHTIQEGIFPASALNRVDTIGEEPIKKTATVPAKRGRKPGPKK